MKWVTCERPKIDRIACPLLIERFIDQQAEFLYVPTREVLRIANETGAVPYDIPGVEMTHLGELCSFGMNMGKPVRGTWKVTGQSPCYVLSHSSSEEECYEVKHSGNEVRLFRYGYETFSGTLTPILPRPSKE